jgi:hypothetical protein
MSSKIYNQQVNRLSTLGDDKSISIDYVKQLVESKTGKSVARITAKQVFGKSADYSTDNRCFFALNMTMFPVPGAYVAGTPVACPVVSNLQVNLNADQSVLYWQFDMLQDLQLSATVKLYINGVLKSSSQVNNNNGYFVVSDAGLYEVGVIVNCLSSVSNEVKASATVTVSSSFSVKATIAGPSFYVMLYNNGAPVPADGTYYIWVNYDYNTATENNKLGGIQVQIDSTHATSGYTIPGASSVNSVSVLWVNPDHTRGGQIIALNQ